MTFLSQPATDTQITHARRLWLYALAALAVLFLVAPTLLIIPMSFSGAAALEFPPKTLSLRWYQSFLASRDWVDAATMSLKDATATMLIATPLGVAAAYCTLLSRSSVARALAAVLTLPMMMPAILIAIGLYFVYVPLGMNNSLPGLVLAHVSLTMPYVYVLVVSRLKSYDFNQELAAQSLGATRLQSFLKVTLPQIKPSIIAAALLSFIFSFDEGVVSYFIATGRASTLPRRMFLSLQFGVDPTIAAISSGLILFTIAVVLITQLMSARAVQSDGASP